MKNIEESVDGAWKGLLSDEGQTADLDVMPVFTKQLCHLNVRSETLGQSL